MPTITLDYSDNWKVRTENVIDADDPNDSRPPADDLFFIADNSHMLLAVLPDTGQTVGFTIFIECGPQDTPFFVAAQGGVITGVDDKGFAQEIPVKKGRNAYIRVDDLSAGSVKIAANLYRLDRDVTS